MIVEQSKMVTSRAATDVLMFKWNVIVQSTWIPLIWAMFLVHWFTHTVCVTKVADILFEFYLQTAPFPLALHLWEMDQIFNLKIGLIWAVSLQWKFNSEYKRKLLFKNKLRGKVLWFSVEAEFSTCWFS